MPDFIFADGLAEISATAGVVRLELFALLLDRKGSISSNDPPKMQMERTVTIAIPMSGFVTALKSIDDFKQRLVDSGILKIAPDAPPGSAGAPSPIN